MAIFPRSPANEKDEINNGLAAGASFSFSPRRRGRARFPSAFPFLAPATQARDCIVSHWMMQARVCNAYYM